ncbi:MAG TPA: hypothetical protein VFB30_11255, partial [Spirochaetia bacterium]|nr:hypothetical protein [Spirochaetia bacterium]
MADQNPEGTFRVIDRRPFTSEGELRPDVVKEQEREAKVEAAHQLAKDKAAATPPTDSAAAPPKE